MLPTFIGVGAPKSGTTWLFECLKEHPEVFMTPVKETDFFASYREEHEEGVDYTDADAYGAYFEGGEAVTAVGEISVGYLADPGVPARIHRMLPDVRLVVVLRNPVDQVYSLYWHLNRQNFHQWYASSGDGQLSFEEALAGHRERLVEPAFYHRHLERWLEHFDRSQLHIILYDDLSAHPEQVLGELYAFLGVDPAFVPDSIRSTGSQVRKGTSPRGPIIHKLYLNLYTVLSRSVYLPLKRFVGTDRAARVKDALRVRELMETIFRKKGYPEMKRATRRSLQAEYGDDVERLGALVDRDLSVWLSS